MNIKLMVLLVGTLLAGALFAGPKLTFSLGMRDYVKNRSDGVTLRILAKKQTPNTLF